jgi:glycosyltransferase involved in cell wall biosynthesis
MRVAVLVGGVYPTTIEIWEASAAHAEIFVIGAEPGHDLNPWEQAHKLPGVEYLSPRTPLRSRDKTWWYYRHLNQALNRISPDVIHVHAELWSICLFQTLMARARNQLQSNPAIVAHGCENLRDHGQFARDHVREALRRAAVRRLDGYASWNSDGLVIAESAGLRAGASRGVFPGVTPSPQRFFPASDAGRHEFRVKLGVGESELLVGYIGRLDETKGVPDILNAFPNGSSRVHLLFMGSGPLAATTTRWLGDHASGQILPASSSDRVACVLRSLDVLLVPSRTSPEWEEQFGRVVVEAMFSGTPVVVTRTGSLPEVTGGNALIIPERSPDALRRAIDTLADPGTRRRLARDARRFALATHAPTRVAERAAAFWADAVTHRARR